MTGSQGLAADGTPRSAADQALRSLATEGTSIGATVPVADGPWSCRVT